MYYMFLKSLKMIEFDFDDSHLRNYSESFEMYDHNKLK